MKKEINIDEDIYKICSVIYELCNLNVEFIGNNSNDSFQLTKSKTPKLLATSKSNTLTNIHNSLKTEQTIKLIQHTDSYELNFLSIGFFHENQYKGTIILGPFLSKIPDYLFINKVITKNQLHISNRFQLESYYNTLPILDVNDTKYIGTLMLNLVSNPFIPYKISYLQDENNVLNKKENYFETEELTGEIDLRYKLEKDILNAVEKGAKEEALKFQSLFHFKASHRAPNNPLRAYKNLAFSFNTLLRTACERGGVSPIYIHGLSDKAAILIENLSTMEELQSISAILISDYCDLVNKYSTSGYSNIVKKAINYINYNYQNKLSLSIISKEININPSHLSRQFKKETNTTITQFINTKRINEAKFLIKQSTNSITEIAFIVGFENHNYFCKVFKQLTNMTPLEYFKESSLD